MGASCGAGLGTDINQRQRSRGPGEGFFLCRRGALVTGLILSVAVTTALAQSSSVAAWGDNSNHQTNLPTGLTNIVALAAGANHSLALRGDGVVLAWGDDSSLQVTL